MNTLCCFAKFQFGYQYFDQLSYDMYNCSCKLDSNLSELIIFSGILSIDSASLIYILFHKVLCKNRCFG